MRKWLESAENRAFVAISGLFLVCVTAYITCIVVATETDSYLTGCQVAFVIVLGYYVPMALWIMNAPHK